MTKQDFFLKLEMAGIDKPKCKFVYKEKGLYGESEIWIYPKGTGNIGTLVTEETCEDIDYLREYLNDFVYKPNA